MYKLDWTFILIIIKKFKKLYNNKTLHTWNAFFLIRVFKPGLVQDLGESPGSILIFFNQNDIVLVKNKQKSTGCNRVFDWILPDPPCHRVTLIFDFPYFFLNPTRFQPQLGRILDQPVGPDWVSKLCFEQ